MKKKAKKRSKIHYNPNPTPKKIFITMIALIIGNIFFAYSGAIASSATMSTLFFNPAVISTSVLLAAASYLIVSLVKE